MSEIHSTKPELGGIEEGLSAIALPELKTPNEWGRLEPPTQEQALTQLNTFLGNLNSQGVDLVSVLEIKVTIPESPGVAGGSETRKVAILRKPKKS